MSEVTTRFYRFKKPVLSTNPSTVSNFLNRWNEKHLHDTFKTFQPLYAGGKILGVWIVWKKNHPR